MTVLPFGGDVVSGVAQGRFEIGVSQSSEIVSHPDVVLAGGLPAPFAHRTRYLAAKTPGAGPAADALLVLLAGPQGRAAPAARWASGARSGGAHSWSTLLALWPHRLLVG